MSSKLHLKSNRQIRSRRLVVAILVIIQELLVAPGLLTGFTTDVAYGQGLDLPEAPASTTGTTTGTTPTTRTTTTTTQTTTQAASSLPLEAGEIMLDGVILGMAPDANNAAEVKLTLQALSFGLPGKPVRSINPPKTKLVTFNTQAMPAGSPPLRAGMRVQVVGPDDGTGATLVARALFVLEATGPAGTFPVPSNAKAKQYTGHFPTQGVTLTEVHMPAKLAPHAGEIPRLFAFGFAPNGNTLYTECKWITRTKDGGWDIVDNPKYAWSHQHGLQKVAENSPPWKEFWAKWQVASDRLNQWQVAHKAELLVSNPGQKVDSWGALGMTADGNIVCGWYALTPANFPAQPSGDLQQQELRAWFKAKSDATTQVGFIWRADTGFVNFEKYLKSLPGSQGKAWHGLLTPGAITGDGKAISCMVETGKRHEMLSPEHILLVNNPKGFRAKNGLSPANLKVSRGTYHSLLPHGVTIVQSPLKEWGKGWVTQFTPDGKMVQGRFIHSPQGSRSEAREWQWSLAQGFQIGQPAPEGKQFHDTEFLPVTGQLGAWKKKYGEWHESRMIGSHMALGIFPTSISRDGSVVVGRYQWDVTGARPHDAYYGTGYKGQEVAYYNRCFVWRKGTGFHDLWDYAAPMRKIEPEDKSGRDSCAVSPDGQKIAAVTDHLYLLSANRGFPFPKVAADTAPLASLSQ